jgi:hypothetical protein
MKKLVALAAASLLTRWAFRSHYLFSWDSGNFALAMDHIDVAAHRPHPPGYLAYVFAGRLLRALGADTNAALVGWNILATAAIVVIVARFARELAHGDARAERVQWTAAAIMLTSPLLWFYGEVAEIYVSELLGTLVIAFFGWRAARGNARALYWCVLALAATALFKLTAAIFMLPVAIYAWWRAPAAARRRAAWITAAATAAVAAVFVAVTPRLPQAVWEQFVFTMSGSGVATGRDSLERLNHNSRDTATAMLAMLGAVNLLVLPVAVMRRRRSSALLETPLILLWSVPWLLLCLGLHIAKPGYLLPLLPVCALLLAGTYAACRSSICASLVAAQAAINVAAFVATGPLGAEWTGGNKRYRSKTLVERLASDLEPLTFPTAATIRASDAAVARALAVSRETCPSGRQMIISEGSPLDVRRVMFYLPAALAVHSSGAAILGRIESGVLRTVTDGEDPIDLECPILWALPGPRIAQITFPPGSRSIDGAGVLVPARSVRLTPSGIVIQ